MKSVGLRELKNNLSEYVREVRSGESVLVTDRGEVVAELLPAGPGLDEMGVPFRANGTGEKRASDARRVK